LWGGGYQPNAQITHCPLYPYPNTKKENFSE
jgi:hypothetical protein